MNQKRIVCFGDSNTWGFNAETESRFEDSDRWTRVLSQQLGSGFQVLEEGLCGRTTVFDDPLRGSLRGLDYLYPCLMSHSPLDFLVIMLGTNDCKARYSATPQNVADGLERLLLCAKAAPVWRDETRILVVAPILIGEECYRSPVAGEMGPGCVEKSHELPRLMELLASQQGCSYLDCNTVCKANTIDFMHLDLESHGRLGIAVAEQVRKSLNLE